MEQKIPDILSKDNYEALMSWMTTPGSEQPAFASEFMTTLDALYMNRSGQTIRRRPVGTAPSKLSLEYIMSQAGRQKPDRPTHREVKPNPVLEDLTALAESLPEKSTPRIEDNTLPLQDENGFKEAGLDSIRLAGAVAWHWSRLDRSLTGGRPVSMSFLQMTLYIIYGTVLAERGTRITSERPQMWRFGPVFARAYSYLTKRGISPNEEAAEEIRHSDPSLDEFISRITRINAGKKLSDLSKYHMSKSSPWGQCNKRNPEKWSTPLDDNELRDWFRQLIDKSKTN